MVLVVCACERIDEDEQVGCSVWLVRISLTETKIPGQIMMARKNNYRGKDRVHAASPVRAPE